MSRCSLHIQTHEGAVQGLELWGPRRVLVEDGPLVEGPVSSKLK